jgi:DNA-binding HxlR family transcriptional regulator
MAVGESRKSAVGELAASSEALDLVVKRWTPQLLRFLLGGPARFNEVVNAVPTVSRRVLTERLRELQDAGLIERRVDSGPPITSTYSLTSAGGELRPMLDELFNWAVRWSEGRQAG